MTKSFNNRLHDQTNVKNGNAVLFLLKLARHITNMKDSEKSEEKELFNFVHANPC